MFTGIVDHQGVVLNTVVKDSSLDLTIQSQFTAINLGESIAVAGVCLTVIAADDGILKFEVSPETIALTSLGNLVHGESVNLERAVAAQALLGGHLVSGHVDGQLKLAQRKVITDYVQLDFLVEREQWLDLLVDKGSVAINGVSLTVNRVTETGFTVMCVPHTLQVTTLSDLSVNDKVNIEFDMVAKMLQKNMQRYLQKQDKNITLSEESP
jgi:riboflavin synthase